MALYATLPRLRCGFDSRHPLQKLNDSSKDERSHFSHAVFTVGAAPSTDSQVSKALICKINMRRCNSCSVLQMVS